jgi:branched-chain amino acid transport system substrate-binding protein
VPLAVLALAGCGVTASSEIGAPVTVYVSLPLTGPRAADGRDAADGARLALEQASGKAGSLEVRGRFLDDAKGKAWDPATVGDNARAAVQDSSAAAYLGELDSEPTRASVPITNDAGLVEVSPGAGAVDLTRPAAGYPDSPERYRPSGSASFARVVPDDEVQVGEVVDWLSQEGARSAFVVSDGSPFGDLQASEFEQAARERGVEIAVGRSQADAVFDTATQLLTMARPRAQTLTTAEVMYPARLPGKDFPGRFESRFGRAPGPYAAYGYEAMQLILSAVGDAGTSADRFRQSVRDGILDSQRLDESVLGPYSITPDGDTTECMIQRYRVAGSRRAPLEAVCPEP